MVKDPNEHLKRFLQLYDTFKYNGVSDDAVQLWLFSSSLCDNVTDWLDSLELGSVTMWNDLAKKFLYKIFLISRTIQLGVNGHIKSSLDGMSDESLMFHTYERAYKIIDDMSMNLYMWPYERCIYKSEPPTVNAVNKDNNDT
ncbi:hypothetical protein PVK06_010988 [Gossypium arboreum]|uniref:Uncharacterized protein n=1 Tax=Gossypium arboreum TaxID=29729 RepID=A0ABR0Q7K8_GOSAR|nr:hypothetical protein PVK06_010988 [Gossypium arboreum]